MNRTGRSLTQTKLRVRSLLFPRQVEKELHEELQNHFVFQVAQNLEAGLSEEEARREALRSLEGVDRVKERCRDMQGLNWMRDLYRDLRYAFRAFGHNLGFTITAVAILGLGIGSTTAVFSAVDRLLFQSMPYSSPKELVSLGFTLPFMNYPFLFANLYLDWQRQARPFASLGAWTGTAGCDLTEAHPQRLNCAVVDAHFLPTLGVTLELGRNFAPEEDGPHGAAVTIISDGLWRSRFGGDPHVVNRLMNIDGATTRIIGVLPRGFELPNLEEADLLMPQPLPGPGPAIPLRVIGRLKQDITAKQATLQLQPLAQQFQEAAPPPLRPQIHLVLRSLADEQTANVRQSSLVLFGSVVLILLIACANVANLLLARAVSRQREMAVRTALGAGKNRLIRQALAESVLLSLWGGGLGCVLAWLLLFSFKLLAPSAVPHLAQTSLNGRVLLFAAGVSLMNGVLFGLVPALMAIPSEALAGRTARSLGSSSLRQVLTSSQVALSLVLLMLSAVFLQSLWKLAHVSLGINTNNVMLVQLALNSSRYAKAAAQASFLTSLLTSVHRLPGVSAAALSDTVPPGGFVHTRPLEILQVPGKSRAKETGQVVAWRTVSPEYFRTLGIPILRGRPFDEKDQLGKTLSIILSQSLAQQLFGSSDVVGRTVQIAEQQMTAAMVIGVARDVRNNGLASDSIPEYYVVRKMDNPAGNVGNSLAARTLNASAGSMVLLVSGQGKPEALAAWIRSVVQQLDKSLPLQVMTLQSNVQRLSERPRLEAALLSFFGAMALLLAAAGIYGLISFLVAQRVPEIGVRMALGATPPRIMTLFLTQSLWWIGSGIGVGVVVTVLALRSIASLLFDVSIFNPFVFLGIVLLLLGSGMLAALLPARRASQIDPLLALRQE